MKRTSITLNGMNTLIASISVENVSEKKCRKRLARKLDLPIRHISGGKRIRTKVLTSDNSCWSFTKRKTRSDALSDEVKIKVYEYCKNLMFCGRQEINAMSRENDLVQVSTLAT
jgi:hypothetical protein